MHLPRAASHSDHSVVPRCRRFYCTFCAIMVAQQPSEASSSQFHWPLRTVHQEHFCAQKSEHRSVSQTHRSKVHGARRRPSLCFTQAAAVVPVAVLSALYLVCGGAPSRRAQKIADRVLSDWLLCCKLLLLLLLYLVFSYSRRLCCRLFVADQKSHFLYVFVLLLLLVCVCEFAIVTFISIALTKLKKAAADTAEWTNCKQANNAHKASRVSDMMHQHNHQSGRD